MNKPWAHQIEDAASLIRQPYLLIGNDPGTGKSRTVVMGAEEMYKQGSINALVVCCPAPVRSVWSDPDPILGEYAKWSTVPHGLWDFNKDGLPPDSADDRGLRVVVTNPEYIRREAHLERIIRWAKQQHTFLVLDESWLYQNPRAEQTKAAYLLRQACDRVTELNGTPGEMKHLFSQYQILSQHILNVKNWWHFRARYCLTGGYLGKQIVGYQREEEFRRLTAPYTVMRQARECLDIGPEPIRTQIETPLSPRLWRIYKEMEREMIAWLDTNLSASAASAAVKSIRLTQITNGFVGGVSSDADLFHPDSAVQEIGREKLDAIVRHLKTYPSDKTVIFTRYRKDVERQQKTLQEEFPHQRWFKVYGSQNSKDDRAYRREALLHFAPDGIRDPAGMVANTQTGGAGLNLSQASVAFFAANDYPLKTRVQAEKRLDRPGQQGRVQFIDVLATGPDGQRTVDHGILGALRRQEDMTAWTPARWREVLMNLDK